MKKIVFLVMILLTFSANAGEDYNQYLFTVTTTKKIPLSPEQHTTTTETSKKIIFLNKIYEEYDEGMDISYRGVSDGEYNLKTDQNVNISFTVSNGTIQKMKATPSLPNQVKPIIDECVKSSFLYKFMHAYEDKKTKIKYYMNSNNGSKYIENIAVFRFPGEDKIRVMSFWAEGIDNKLYNTKSVLKLDTSTKQNQDNGILLPFERNDPQDKRYLVIDSCAATYYKNSDDFYK